MMVTPTKPRYYGFTPFAKANLLTPDGFVADTKTRHVFILGYSNGAEKVHYEMRTTLRVAFIAYSQRLQYTHLWVKWTDGKRRLVHRKA